MAVAPTYSLTLETTWLPVPLRVPWGEFAAPRDWADELATSLLAGTGVGGDVRDRLRDTALQLQAMPGPLPGAMERFWRTEFVGGPAVVAHLYVTDSDAATAEDLLQLARAGIGGTIQTWATLEATSFDEAIVATAISEIDGGELFGLRHLGVRDGFVFLLDFLSQDPLFVEAVQGELETIFRSIDFP